MRCGSPVPGSMRYTAPPLSTRTALLWNSPTVVSKAAPENGGLLKVCTHRACNAVRPPGPGPSRRTTVASSIPELKGRVEKLSDLLNRAVAQPPSGAARPSAPFVSAFEPANDGGRLVLKPKNAADLEKLQTNVSGKIGAMNSQKTCHLLANVN